MGALGNYVDFAIETEFKIVIRLYHKPPGSTDPQEIWSPRPGHTGVTDGETINRHRAAVMASNAGLDEDRENEYCESDCESRYDSDCGPHYAPQMIAVAGRPAAERNLILKPPRSAAPVHGWFATHWSRDRARYFTS